jgi:probable phosphoglycerate mutase
MAPGVPAPHPTLRMPSSPTVGERTRELWLVRHGETTASSGRTLAGWEDVQLTEHGESEAAALRPLLAGVSFAGVWSSDLSRALATARLAWGEPRPDPRLREMSFGAFEGVAWEGLDPGWQEALLRFEGFEAPGGESFHGLKARVHAFIEALGAGRHLLFTHGGVVRLLSREVGVDRFVATGTLLVIDWDGRRLLSRHEAGAGPAPVAAATPHER